MKYLILLAALLLTSCGTSDTFVRGASLPPHVVTFEEMKDAAQPLANLCDYNCYESFGTIGVVIGGQDGWTCVCAPPY